jgi:cellulose synthase/poly-beta-1,6-N-acetylglucosamine synthase-like glycosyltransferase
MIWIVVFCAGAALPFYTLFVYPALLGVLSRWRAWPVDSKPQRKTVSVIIPVCNGERFLDAKLRSVLSLEYPRELLDVLVVSDGSTDGTDAIAQSFSGEGVRLLRVPRGGKPAALNAAFGQVGGEILLLTDVRQILAGGSLQLLVDCFADPSVGAASGTLLIRKGSAQEEEAVGLYWRYETWIRERLSRIDSIFGAVGPFYALRRELAARIPEDILLDDMYLPLTAYFAGRRLIVEPRAVAWDVPLPLKTEFQRKVRTIAGNFQLLAAMPGLLGWSNRMWFHFMSYKVARLLMPFALLLAAGASFFLPRPWNWLALAAQAGCYGLAALDPLIPEKAALKRVSSLIRTFVTMLVATLCALQILFVPPKKLWKVTNIESAKGDAADAPTI